VNERLKKAIKAEIEARQALNGLADDAPSEDREKAVKALEDAGKEVLAALEAAEPEPVPLRVGSRASLQRYMGAIMEQRAFDGAEAEVNQGLGLDDRSQIPWEVLDPAIEQRADAPPPDITNLEYTTRAILRRVFHRTDLGFLGVDMPSVGAGVAVFPVFGSDGAAAMFEANAAADAKAYTVSGVTISPTRATTRYLLNLENMAQIGGEVEGVLRDDMREQLSQLVNAQIIGGSGAAPNLSGILKELTTPDDPGAVLTAADMKAVPVNALDNRYVGSESDVRALIGLRAYKKARSVYLQENDKTTDGIAALTGTGGRVRASSTIAGKRTPADTSKPETAYIDYGIVTGQPMGVVAPVWQGVTVIRDPYTQAAAGQVALTAHMLYGFKFKRKDGWSQVGLKVL